MIPWASALGLLRKLIAFNIFPAHHQSQAHLRPSAAVKVQAASIFTLHHPGFVGYDSHNGTYSTGSNGSDRFMHTAICVVSASYGRDMPQTQYRRCCHARYQQQSSHTRNVREFCCDLSLEASARHQKSGQSQSLRLFVIHWQLACRGFYCTSRLYRCFS